MHTFKAEQKDIYIGRGHLDLTWRHGGHAKETQSTKEQGHSVSAVAAKMTA